MLLPCCCPTAPHLSSAWTLGSADAVFAAVGVPSPAAWGGWCVLVRFRLGIVFQRSEPCSLSPSEWCLANGLPTGCLVQPSTQPCAHAVLRASASPARGIKQSSHGCYSLTWSICPVTCRGSEQMISWSYLLLSYETQVVLMAPRKLYPSEPAACCPWQMLGPAFLLTRQCWLAPLTFLHLKWISHNKTPYPAAILAAKQSSITILPCDPVGSRPLFVKGSLGEKTARKEQWFPTEGPFPLHRVKHSVKETGRDSPVAKGHSAAQWDCILVLHGCCLYVLCFNGSAQIFYLYTVSLLVDIPWNTRQAMAVSGGVF